MCRHEADTESTDSADADRCIEAITRMVNMPMCAHTELISEQELYLALI